MARNTRVTYHFTQSSVARLSESTISSSDSQPSGIVRGANLIESELIKARFELKRHLGEGGFGVVFDAYDRQRRARVALKALHRIEPASLLRFKREFRTLTGFSHPHLVQLYELIADDANWFMTMEYVDGTDFLTAVTREPEEDDEDRTFPAQAETMDLLVPATGPIDTMAHGRDVDYDVLLDATRQLVGGITELHDNGILHRDLKPSNVLVDSSGRVVILDFGMVQELRPTTETPTRKNGFVGTPHYIAPEQAMGKEAGRESDWYSVGVMLHEVLIGGFPVDGRTSIQILLRKQQEHVPERTEFPPDCPEELVDLCRDLLALEPRDRPTGTQIRERLGSGTTPDESQERVFVGRLAELAELDHAHRRVRSSGKPVIANVRAVSGMGKSALAQEFIERLDDDVMVLSARCYESESVPFKAVDGLVDELIERLELKGAGTYTDGIDLADIGRLFPVVRKLLKFDDEQGVVLGDELAARRRAFEAMRGLMHRIAADRRVVVWIDDAQWGDRDSVALLAALVRGNDPPPILWLVTARSEDHGESVFLAEWEELLEDLDDRVKVVDIALGSLSTEESAELANNLLGDGEEAASTKILQEAKGHPFFIDELARHRARRARVDSTITSLDDLIRYRFDALDDASKKLLEAVAVAGQPIEFTAARDVARLGDRGPASFARLRNERLIRVRSNESGSMVEAYHDRIRETVRDGLPAKRRKSIHLNIAQSLQELAPDAYDRLRLHFREGGASLEASRFGLLAGEQAARALAFDEAIEAYEEALALGDWDTDKQHDVHRQLGDWNALLARGNEASDAYRAASRTATHADVRVELEQKAAEQLIRCGQLERGMAAMSGVMSQLGVSTPSDTMLLPALIWRAISFKFRGDGYELGDPAAGIDRARLDALWALANLMATIDVRLGAYYQLVNLRHALDSGDRVSILRALGLQAVHDATTPKNRPRAQLRLAEAAELLKEVDEDAPFHESWLAFASGLTAYMAGDFESGVHGCREAIEILESNQLSTRWEVASIESYELQCVFFTGDFGGFEHLTAKMIEEAQAARDFLHLIAVGLWAHYVDLAHGDPDGAQRRLDDAIEGWSDLAYHLQDFWYLKGRANVAIFRGDGASALQWVRDEWSDVKKAFILNSETGLVTAWDLRMRAALGAAVDGDVGSARAEIKRAKRALSRWKPAWGEALVALHEAELAVLTGAAGATELVAAAEARCDDCGLVFYRDAARVLLGHVVGGERGEEMRKRPLDELHEDGVTHPEAFLSVFAPSLRRYRKLIDAS